MKEQGGYFIPGATLLTGPNRPTEPPGASTRAETGPCNCFEKTLQARDFSIRRMAFPFGSPIPLSTGPLRHLLFAWLG